MSVAIEAMIAQQADEVRYRICYKYSCFFIVFLCAQPNSSLCMGVVDRLDKDVDIFAGIFITEQVCFSKFI